MGVRCLVVAFLGLAGLACSGNRGAPDDPGAADGFGGEPPTPAEAEAVRSLDHAQPSMAAGPRTAGSASSPPADPEEGARSLLDPVVAGWINRVHNAMHPRVEAVQFALDALPRDHPANDWSRKLAVELDFPPNGTPTIELTTPSTSVQFDQRVMQALKTTEFPLPPDELRGPDGHVRLHWMVHRNPVYGCSTYFARLLPAR